MAAAARGSYSRRMPSADFRRRPLGFSEDEDKRLVALVQEHGLPPATRGARPAGTVTWKFLAEKFSEGGSTRKDKALRNRYYRLHGTEEQKSTLQKWGRKQKKGDALVQKRHEWTAEEVQRLHEIVASGEYGTAGAWGRGKGIKWEQVAAKSRGPWCTRVAAKEQYKRAPTHDVQSRPRWTNAESEQLLKVLDKAGQLDRPGMQRLLMEKLGELGSARSATSVQYAIKKKAPRGKRGRPKGSRNKAKKGKKGADIAPPPARWTCNWRRRLCRAAKRSCCRWGGRRRGWRWPPPAP
eukprot:COSAG04_NODE_998_length_8854_cov_3.254369_4_plen_295_part_00